MRVLIFHYEEIVNKTSIVSYRHVYKLCDGCLSTTTTKAELTPELVNFQTALP